MRGAAGRDSGAQVLAKEGALGRRRVPMFLNDPVVGWRYQERSFAAQRRVKRPTAESVSVNIETSPGGPLERIVS